VPYLSIRDLRSPDTHEVVAAQMAKAIREGLLFETEHRRKDGSIFPVEVSSKSIEEGKLLISVIRDITERKRAEAALLAAYNDLEARVDERTRQLEETNEALRAENLAVLEARRVIEQQTQELLDRSAPVLSIWSGLLLCPLAGPVDEARVAGFAERLLRSIVEKNARILLFDVTAVSNLDGEAVRALVGVISAARLLGTDVIVTGIRAAAAMELATSGVDTAGLSTYSTLAKGLAEAFRRMRQENRAE
jgi:rsbT co-antagonist protein RsbR